MRPLMYVSMDSLPMEYLLIPVVLGFIPAVVASNKGHDFLTWWLFGALLFIVALPMALIVKPSEAGLVRRGDVRKCPHCAELVKREARVCRFCSRDLKPVTAAEARRKTVRSTCPRCGDTVPTDGKRSHRCPESRPHGSPG